jgi:hypothetical protein
MCLDEERVDRFRNAISYLSFMHGYSILKSQKWVKNNMGISSEILLWNIEIEQLISSQSSDFKLKICMNRYPKLILPISRK